MPEGAVKFFNAAKGFGFIAPDNGSPDIFVHVSALERSGISNLNEGDRVSFDVEQNPRSGKVAAIDLQVLSASAAGQARPPERGRGGFGRDDFGQNRARTGEATGQGHGVVKWFNPAKGYGFIQPDDGGNDVFVHISAVEQAGLRGLEDGQTVTFDLERNRAGKLSATNLRLTD